MAKRGLTPKQERFIQEYLVDLTAKQAAIRAGYNPKTAGQLGYQLLQKTSIQAALQVEMEKRAKRVELTADRVLEEIRRLALADPRNIFEWGESGVKLKDSNTLTEEQAAAVAEASESQTKYGGTIRIKLHDKVAALKLAAQHLGLLVEKHEHSGPGGGPIPMTILPYSEVQRRLEELRSRAESSGDARNGTTGAAGAVGGGPGRDSAVGAGAGAAK